MTINCKRVCGGWRWKAEIIRENIKKARDKCSREEKSLSNEIDELQKETIDPILSKWIEKGVFSSDETKRGFNKENIEAKLGSIIKTINEYDRKISHYSGFYDNLIKKFDLEDKDMVKNIIRVCEEKKEFLDEKEDVENLKEKFERYWDILTAVLERGGGIKNRIRDLEDEEKKAKIRPKIKRKEERAL